MDTLILHPTKGYFKGHRYSDQGTGVELIPMVGNMMCEIHFAGRYKDPAMATDVAMRHAGYPDVDKIYGIKHPYMNHDNLWDMLQCKTVQAGMDDEGEWTLPNSKEVAALINDRLVATGDYVSYNDTVKLIFQKTGRDFS